MDTQLDAMVRLEMEQAAGGGGAGVAAPPPWALGAPCVARDRERVEFISGASQKHLGSEGDGAGDWSRRAAAMESQLRWQLERCGAAAPLSPSSQQQGQQQQQQFPPPPPLASALALSAEHEVRARAARIETEHALQRATTGGTFLHQHGGSSSSMANAEVAAALRREVVGLQLQLGNSLQRLEDERTDRQADPKAAQLARDNARLTRENATLTAALVVAHGGTGRLGAMHAALVTAQMDLGRANERAVELEAALAEMVRGASSATHLAAGGDVKANGRGVDGRPSWDFSVRR